MRRISELTISGYRSVSSEHPCTLRFGDVTLLIGPNGAGKSNLLSVLRMMQHGIGERLVPEVEKGDAQAQFHLGPKHTSEAKFHVQLDSQGGQAVSMADWSFAFGAPNRISLTCEALPAEAVAFFAKVGVYQFNDTTLFANMRLPAYVANDGMLLPDAHNMAPFLLKMKKTFPAYYERLLWYVTLALPDFDDFVLEEDPQTRNVMLNWKGTGSSGYIYGPHQLSDGSLRFIALAALLLAPSDMSPALIAIDEPEIGLHPAAISALSGMMKHAAAHAQVIVATQSPLLVDEFSVGEIRVVERVGSDGYTVCRSLDKKTLSNWLDEYSLSDLWQKNIIGGNP